MAPILFPTTQQILWAAGSLVNYTGTNQAVSVKPYSNLTWFRNKDLIGATTVNNNLSIEGTTTLASDIYQITGNATTAL